MKRILYTAFACLVLGITTLPTRADVLVGTDNSANCYPFGNGGFSGTYQQLYAAAAFNGPITITALQFATDDQPYNTPGIENLDFTLSLETTSASPTNIGSFASNIAGGTGLTQVFSGPLTYHALDNGTFDLTIPIAPFTYDPGAGNLLMQVNLISSSGVTNYLEAGNNSNVARNYGGAQNGYGLVTNFVTGASAVPEPGAYALLASFGLSGALLLRRRRAHK